MLKSNFKYIITSINNNVITSDKYISYDLSKQQDIDNMISFIKDNVIKNKDNYIKNIDYNIDIEKTYINKTTGKLIINIKITFFDEYKNIDVITSCNVVIESEKIVLNPKLYKKIFN